MTPYYEDGGIKLYCADWRDLDLQQMGPWDLLLVDSPYRASYASNPILGKNRKSAPHESQTWDDEIQDICPLLTLAADCIIWGGNYYPLPPSRGWLVWYKPDALPSMADCELAWTSRDANTQHFTQTTAKTNAERWGHCTQKPLALMKWCISLVPTAKTLLDPYCGSGTSLVAAKQMGLSAVGVEREESYCEIAAKRLSQSVFDFSAPPEPAEQMKLIEPVRWTSGVVMGSEFLEHK